MKLSQGDELLMNKLRETHGTATDFTSSKNCRLKVRAVGLDQEITKWLEKNMRGMRDCFEITQAASLQSVHKLKAECAKKFITSFVEKLQELKVSQKLQRYIFDHLMCFGPKRLGTNMLINKLNNVENSMLRTVEKILGEKLIPVSTLEQGKQNKIEKELKANCAKMEAILLSHQLSIDRKSVV